MRSLKKLVEDLSRENESLQDESGHLRREVYEIQQSRDADRRSIMKLTEHKRVLLAALNSIQEERVSKSISRGILMHTLGLIDHYYLITPHYLLFIFPFVPMIRLLNDRN